MMQASSTALRATRKSLINSYFIRFKTDASSDFIFPDKADNAEDPELLAKMRNKSGLTDADYRRQHRLAPLLTEDQRMVMKLADYRKLYGQYGSSANVNVASLWPSKEEMALQREWEEVAFPHSIQEMIQIERVKKRQEEEEIRAKQELAKEKLKSLEQWKQKVRQKMKKDQEKAREAIEKKKQQLYEVRQILGYNIDPRDEKFAEILAIKEEKDKKAKKKQRKLEKEQKVLDEMTSLAEKEAQMGSPIVKGIDTPAAKAVPKKKEPKG